MVSETSLQVPVIHIRRMHPVQTFDGSHLSNVFTEQTIINV